MDIPPTPGVIPWAFGSLRTLFAGTPRPNPVDDRVFAALNKSLHDAMDTPPIETPVKMPYGRGLGFGQGQGQGILKTPGTVGPTKNVTFDAGVHLGSSDNVTDEDTTDLVSPLGHPNEESPSERTRRIRSGLPSNFPGKFPSPWTPKTRDLDYDLGQGSGRDPVVETNTRANAGTSVGEMRQNVEDAKVHSATSSATSSATNSETSSQDPLQTILHGLKQNNERIAQLQTSGLADAALLSDMKHQLDMALSYAQEKDSEASLMRQQLANALEDNTRLSRHAAEKTRNDEYGLQSRVESLQSRIEALQAERDALRADRKTLQTQLTTLQTEKTALQTEKMALQTENLRLVRPGAQTNTAVQQRLHDEYEARLQRQASEFAAQTRQLMSQHEELLARTVDRTELLQLQKKYADIETKLRHSETDNRDLNSHVNLLLEQVQKTGSGASMSEIESLRRRLVQSQTEVMQLQRKLAQADHAPSLRSASGSSGSSFGSNPAKDRDYVRPYQDTREQLRESDAIPRFTGVFRSATAMAPATHHSIQDVTMRDITMRDVSRDLTNMSHERIQLAEERVAKLLQSQAGLSQVGLAQTRLARGSNASVESVSMAL